MLTRKEKLEILFALKEKDFGQGDDIYNLSERERGDREGYNEAIRIIKEIIAK